MQVNEIYIVKVCGKVASYIPTKRGQISYAPAEKFIDFVKGVIEDYPNFKITCVGNEGIREVVAKKIIQDKVALNCKKFLKQKAR